MPPSQSASHLRKYELAEIASICSEALNAIARSFVVTKDPLSPSTPSQTFPRAPTVQPDVSLAMDARYEADRLERWTCDITGYKTPVLGPVEEGGDIKVDAQLGRVVGTLLILATQVQCLLKDEFGGGKSPMR